MNSMAEQVLVNSSHRSKWEDDAGSECACVVLDDGDSKYTFLDGSYLRFVHDIHGFEAYMMDGVLWDEVRVIGGGA